MNYELAMSHLEDYRPNDSLKSKREKLTQDIVTGAGNISEMSLAYLTLKYGANGDLLRANLVENLEKITIMVSSFFSFIKNVPSIKRHLKQVARAGDRVKSKENEPVTKLINKTKVENYFLDTNHKQPYQDN